MSEKREEGGPGHYERVRAFHDRDAARYLDARYGAANVVQLGYLVRRQLVVEMMEGVTGDLLDCGCGPGPLFEHVPGTVRRIFATDISVEMLRKAREELVRRGRSPLVCASNLVQAGLMDQCVDGIVCVGVLGYVADLDGALREIRRMLRPGGVAILQTSNSSSLRERLYEKVIPRIKQRIGWAGRAGLGIDFSLASYTKREFDARAVNLGFELLDWSYYDFQIPFLERASVTLSMRFARRMQRFGRREWGRHLGGGYVVKVRKGPARSR